MKRTMCVAALLLGMIGLYVHADSPDLTASAFETISVTTTTAVGISTTTMVSRAAFGSRGGGTNTAYCTVETDSIRFRFDGTAPTRTVGHPSASNSNFTLTGYQNIRNLSMIGSGTATATVTCTSEKTDAR